jgi:predicted transcriptional regulator
MKVKDIFCPDLSSVSEHMTIRTVIRLMLLSRSYAIPIVSEENKYISCIDISDIIEACVPFYMKSILSPGVLPDIEKFYENLNAIQGRKVSDFIPKKYPRLQPEDSINFAADLLEKSKRQVIPVVENDQLVGTLSRLEIVSAILTTELSNVLSGNS